MKWSFHHLELFQVDFTEDQIEDIKDGFELYDRTGEGKLFFNQVNFRCRIHYRKYLMRAKNSIEHRVIFRIKIVAFVTFSQESCPRVKLSIVPYYHKCTNKF